MMKNHTKEIAAILCLLGAMLLHTNCRRTTVDTSAAVGDTITMKYASLLTIVKYDGYTTVDSQPMERRHHAPPICAGRQDKRPPHFAPGGNSGTHTHRESRGLHRFA